MQEGTSGGHSRRTMQEDIARGYLWSQEGTAGGHCRRALQEDIAGGYLWSQEGTTGGQYMGAIVLLGRHSRSLLARTCRQEACNGKQGGQTLSRECKRVQGKKERPSGRKRDREDIECSGGKGMQKGFGCYHTPWGTL
jgi:hypothetical protein